MNKETKQNVFGEKNEYFNKKLMFNAQLKKHTRSFLIVTFYSYNTTYYLITHTHVHKLNNIYFNSLMSNVNNKRNVQFQ